MEASGSLSESDRSSAITMTSSSTTSSGRQGAGASVNRISADLERRKPAGSSTCNDSSLSPVIGGGSRPAPPTPPGSPVDRPFPAATLPPPPGAVSTSTATAGGSSSHRHTARRVGDGSGTRRGKSETRSVAGASASSTAGHGRLRKTRDGVPMMPATDDDLIVRQPSDGYQALDENNSRLQDSSDCLSSSLAGHSVSSDSGDSSSECDWSEDEGDSSDDNSEDEGQGRAPREAADGMSSDTETECLL